MKKYTSKTMKVDLYSQKYNLSKEYVKDILSKDECLLTLEELKIKYDCPDLGKLPDWLTEDELSKIIWKTIHEKYDSKYSYWISKEELYSYFQEFIRLRLHLFNSPKHIKTAIVNRFVWLLRQHLGRGSYFCMELDKPVPGVEDKNLTYGSLIPNKDTYTNDKILLDNILSIKDNNIKQLLIVIGYLVCDISFLHDYFIDVMNNADNNLKNNLQQLYDRMEKNISIELIKNSGITIKHKRKSITIQDICNSFNISQQMFESIKHRIIQYNLI